MQQVGEPGREGALGAAGLDPFRAVVRDAHRLGDRVGGLEADPPHISRQPVRLETHDVDGPVLVLLVDADGQGSRHPHTLEKDHHFLDGLLLLPGVGDALGALGPMPLTIPEPRTVV
jgi:hypothetical protein